MRWTGKRRTIPGGASDTPSPDGGRDEVVPADIAQRDTVQSDADAAVAARAVARDRAVNIGGRRRARVRSAVGAASGILLLGATAAVSSGVVTGGLAAPGGSVAAGSTDVSVPTATVPAGDHVAVCPAPPRLFAPAADGADPEFSASSASARTTVSAMVLGDLGSTLPGSGLVPAEGGAALAQIREFSSDTTPATEEPASSGVSGLTGRVAGVVRGVAVDAPTVLRAQPQGGLTPLAAALTTYTADDGDLRGLAATACQVPSSDLWLVGGTTTPGQSAVLTLTNPSGTPATVTLELFGQEGPIEAAGTRGLLVAPGATRPIVLGGLAGSQELLAVRVRSEGGRVAGVIEQSVLRGLTPGGVELLTPGAAAATKQVVPGVVVQDPAVAGPLRDQEGYAAATPQLQVLVPGSADAVLDIGVYGRDGEVELPGGGVVSAAAGSVTAVALDSLPEGSYTVSVSSDVSVVASARVVRGTDAGDPVDLGGAAAATRLGDDHAVVFPEGADSSLVFGVPDGRAEVTMTPVGPEGALRASVVIGIAGGTSVTVPRADLGADAAGVLIGATGDPVYGAQVLTLPGDRAGISVARVPAGVAGPQDIPVGLGY